MLHSICQQIWKTQPQDWESSIFIRIPKKSSAKECSNYCTITLISHTSKVTLKILQARIQQYMNDELPDVQAGFRKGRGIRDQTVNICWITENTHTHTHTHTHRVFQKNICFIDYVKAFDCVDHNKLENSSREPLTVWITTNWKILQEMGIPDHLTCLLGYLYTGWKQQLELGMAQQTGSK